MRTCSLKSTGEHSGPTEVRLHTRAVCLRHLLYFGSFLTESGCPRHVRFIPDSDCRADISVRQLRAINGLLPSSNNRPFRSSHRRAAYSTSRKIAAGGDDVMELREAWVHSRCPSGPTYRGLRIRENGSL